MKNIYLNVINTAMDIVGHAVIAFIPTDLITIKK